MQTLQPGESRGTPVVGAVVAAAVLVVVAAADLLSPMIINPAIAYPLAVAASASTRSRRMVWAAAGVAVVLTLAGVMWGPEPAPGPPVHVVWINRSFVVLSIVAAATVAHLWVQAYASLRGTGLALQEQNDELRHREDEIARQNEELQSQTEARERQSEELRLANDELARRERALRSLLDLSRSLTAGLSQDETFGRICNALSTLVNHGSTASAILERRGDQMHLRCGAGFGDQGPENENIPFTRSFAQLVWSGTRLRS